MSGAGSAIVICSAFVAVSPLLVTSTSKSVGPAADGVPLIRPVSVFSNRSSGSVVSSNIAHV